MNKENSFKQDCKVINLEIEYKGYIGEERYAIITDLSEDELNARYGKEIEKYKPFVILTKEMGEVFTEYENNEKKYEMRNKRNESLCDWSDEKDDLYNTETTEDVQSLMENELDEKSEEEDSERIIEIVQKALLFLTPRQHEVLIAHCLGGKSYKEIANKSGTTVNSVWSTFKRARKNFTNAILRIMEEDL